MTTAKFTLLNHKQGCDQNYHLEQSVDVEPALERDAAQTVFVEGKGLGVLARKLGIPYQSSRKPLGVRIPADRQQSLERQVALRDERERLAAAHDQGRRDAFLKRFPAASKRTVEKYLNAKVFADLAEVRLSELTEEEIHDLGLQPQSKVGVLLLDGGAKVVPLFTAFVPDDREFAVADSELYERAAAVNFPPHRALWALNKFAKIVPDRRKAIYDMKDRLLQLWGEHLVGGRIARVEKSECWHCGGGDDCDACCGTGVYRSRSLYECRYQFPNDEKVYCFHSYSVPRIITGEPGNDQTRFGHRFTEGERKSLPFNFHELMRIVRHEVALQKATAEQTVRSNLLVRWAALGLPPVREEVPVKKLRSCIAAIDNLTGGAVQV